MDVVSMPKWLWALLLVAAAWAAHQTVAVETMRGVQERIVAEHDRRITKLEDRVDDLTDRMFRMEGSLSASVGSP